MGWLTVVTGVAAIVVAGWLVVRERRSNRRQFGPRWWASPAGLVTLVLDNILSVMLAAAGVWGIWYGLH